MSKVMDFKISVEGLDLPPQDVERTNQELVSIVMHNIMHSYAKNGLRKDERNQYYRIVDVMDEAVKMKADEIELEDQDAGFLKKCAREAQMIPNRLLQRIEDAIEAIKDR